MYWPSFNAALVAPDYVAQHRSVINTYFSLAAACVTTFALSPVFQRNDGKWKLSMVSDHSLNSPDRTIIFKWTTENCENHYLDQFFKSNF